MNSLVSINNKVSLLDEAKISVTDRGFLFGDNIFEVIVAIGGVILDAIPHLERLRLSAEKHRIPVPWSNDELLFEIQGLVDQAQNSKCYIRLMITRGYGLGLNPDPNRQPNKIVFCMPAKVENTEIYRSGLRLKLETATHISRGAAAKTGNYINSITALTKKDDSTYDDILWKNQDHEITEATTSNIFFIGREGDLVEIATPPAHSGILVGITRTRVIKLLTEANIPVTERVIDDSEIARFDEAFLCSSVRGLVPVAKIQNHKLHTPRERSIFNQLKRLFYTWVNTQVGYEVDWNTGIDTTKP